MGSAEAPQLVGEFMYPLIDQDTENDDPWQRNYYQPPKLKKLVPRTSPLIDIRPSVSAPNYVPTDLLKSHGFGVVKHSSAALANFHSQEDLAEQTIVDVYHPEITSLVTKTTGARHVFITATALRRGARSPQEFKLPTGLRTTTAKDERGKSGEKEEAEHDEQTKVAQKTLAGNLVAHAAPVRVPHMDYTPLGARQTIRSERPEIHHAAIESGVIAAEDAICAAAHPPVRAHLKDSDPVIAERYNYNNNNNNNHQNTKNGTLGPRYAAYSIWRPLKQVGRDPIALAPRWPSTTTTTNDTTTADAAAGYVYWPYQNKIPGRPELGGDHMRELAMLGVVARGGERLSSSSSPPSSSEGTTDASSTSTTDENSTALKWYYLSSHKPDEVLFIKLFDSAALGADAEHAGAPWHASPEIGTGAGVGVGTGAAGADGGEGAEAEARESIELRVLAFW